MHYKISDSPFLEREKGGREGCVDGRYKLPVVVIVMNNNGIYGGDRRQQELKAAAQKGATSAGFGSDPVPTAFVPDTRCSTFESSSLSSVLVFTQSWLDIGHQIHHLGPTAVSR